MEIVNFGHFKLASSSGIMFFKNESGQDWYELRKSLTTWTPKGEFINAIYGAWATVDPVTLELKNVEYDPSRLVPSDRIVLGIDSDLDHIKEGMIYSNGQIIEKPVVEPTPLEKRLAMPKISPRQLWLMALRIGIREEDVVQKINESTLPDDDKEFLIIEIRKSPLGGYERMSGAVEDLRKMMSISSLEFDSLWMFASTL